MNTYKVLLIDDEVAVHRIVKPLLANEGIELLSATTGELGVKSAQDHSPDLILLDVILPGIKGREVCEQLKSLEQTRNIPVVFLTAQYQADEVKAELESGGIGHITKPFEARAFVSEVKRVLISESSH